MKPCTKCGKQHDKKHTWCSDCQRKYQREYQREYRQRPEVKAKQREYHQRPEVKAKQRERMREYYQRPEVKAKQREYHQRHSEEIKAKRREYRQRPDAKAKKRERMREYRQRPEVKAREIANLRIKKRRQGKLRMLKAKKEIKDSKSVIDEAIDRGYSKEFAEAYAMDGVLLEKYKEKLK